MSNRELAATTDPGYAVIWKEDGTSNFHVRDCLYTFGLAKTAEEALSRVSHTLRHGRANPPTTAGEFRRQFAGGTFFVVSLHHAIPVPKHSAPMMIDPVMRT